MTFLFIAAVYGTGLIGALLLTKVKRIRKALINLNTNSTFDDPELALFLCAIWPMTALIVAVTAGFYLVSAPASLFVRWWYR